MALSPAQQNKVVQLLGYGAKSIQPGSVIYDKVMNDRLNDIPPSAEALIVSYLNQVGVIELQMAQAPARLAAAQVDEIKMNLDELQMLRAERKRIAKEISQLIDIPYQMPGGVNIGVVA